MSSAVEVKDTGVSLENDQKSSSQPARRGRRGKKATQASTQPQDGDGGKTVTKDGKVVDPVDMMFM